MEGVKKICIAYCVSVTVDLSHLKEHSFCEADEWMVSLDI